jgi:hypothetical protein
MCVYEPFPSFDFCVHRLSIVYFIVFVNLASLRQKIPLHDKLPDLGMQKTHLTCYFPVIILFS